MQLQNYVPLWARTKRLFVFTCPSPWMKAPRRDLLRWWSRADRSIEETNTSVEANKRLLRDTLIYPIPSVPKACNQKKTHSSVESRCSTSFVACATVSQEKIQFSCWERAAKYIRSKAQEIFKSAEESLIALQNTSMRYYDIEMHLFNFVQVSRTAGLPFTRKTLAARDLPVRDKLLDCASDECIQTRFFSFGVSSNCMTCFVNLDALKSVN